MNIALVGEAWGREEEEQGKPFVGASGKLLNKLLSRVGIPRHDCLVTNVFNLRPRPSNDIGNLCGLRADGIPGMPYLQRGKYVRAEYAPELTRLYKELDHAKPNVIIALGATAAWALLRTSGIKALRGTPQMSQWGKVLPTYHPAAVMREGIILPVLMADLHKAKDEAAYPGIVWPHRELWLQPSLADLYWFGHRYIEPSKELSIDIETHNQGRDTQITCVGFAPSTDRALVVPFIDWKQADRSYWRTVDEELRALAWVRWACGLKKRIVGQNHLYDMHVLWKLYKIPMPYAEHDTMLLHHALQPELEKSLDFLGSIYTREARWKLRYRSETLKRED